MSQTIAEKIAQDTENLEFLVIAKYYGDPWKPEDRLDYQATVSKIAKHTDPLEDKIKQLQLNILDLEERLNG